MNYTISKIPQGDDQLSHQKNSPSLIVLLSVIFGASIVLISLVWMVSNPSNEDCTTTTTRYADGRVESKRVCEKTVASVRITLFD